AVFPQGHRYRTAGAAQFDIGAAARMPFPIIGIIRHIGDLAQILAGYVPGEPAPRHRLQSLLIAVELKKRGWSLHGRRAEQLALVSPQNSKRGLAQTDRLFEHCFEHWTEVAR